MSVGFIHSSCKSRLRQRPQRASSFLRAALSRSGRFRQHFKRGGRGFPLLQMPSWDRGESDAPPSETPVGIAVRCILRRRLQVSRVRGSKFGGTGYAFCGGNASVRHLKFCLCPPVRQGKLLCIAKEQGYSFFPHLRQSGGVVVMASAGNLIPA